MANTTNVEIITSTNAEVIESFIDPMAEAYKDDFARAPWFEVSRCDEDACSISFTEHNVDSPCPGCGVAMGPAYTTKELAAKWQKLLAEDNGLVELSLDDDRQFLRATLARPMARSALFETKYHGIPEMRDWIDQTLPERVVWIDDTFADQKRSPRGNMRDRGKTILSLAQQYGDSDAIFTRTKQPPVIVSTIRDLGRYTDMYVGTEGVSSDKYTPRSLATVPDTRTMLGVDARLLRIDEL